MNLTLIPSPFALDQYRQNAGLAPETMLAHGLREGLESDGHIVTVMPRAVELGAGSVLSRIGQHLAVLAECVAAAQQNQSLPVIMGGDCMVAVGVVAGLSHSLDSDFGIAWFDAHGDFNTPETTLSGYLGGMPLACACGRGLAELRDATGLTKPVAEAHVTMVGIRDLDAPEKTLIDSTPIRVYSPATAPQFSAPASPTYLHFDMDCLDPSLATGVNYLVPNGLGLEEALGAARKVKPHLAAFSLTAFDPTRDRNEQTVATAIALLRGFFS
jgi:arginase